MVNGPPINTDLGLVRIVANTNPARNCNPAATAGAAHQLAPAAQRCYSIWMVTTIKGVTNSGGPEQFGGMRVLALQAGP